MAAACRCIGAALQRRFDISAGRVESLRTGHDWTHEVPDAEVASTICGFVSDAAGMARADVFIVAVPAPWTQHVSRISVRSSEPAKRLAREVGAVLA